ncbi:MAG: DUF86 domain-containing protein [Methanosarcinaceae archaeon]|nr:DUF86 domain-containing protein [Methanosarcinaceae archaeon]
MKFDEERKRRYRSKVGYILEKMYALPDTASVVDDLVVDGILYRVQTSIDAAMDMAAMLVRDIGIDVSEDYNNIEILCKNEIIDINLADDLKKLNGMRNAIVHKYGSVDTQLVLQNLENIKEILRNFIEIIEGELA